MHRVGAERTRLAQNAPILSKEIVSALKSELNVATEAPPMPDQDISQYLAYLLASAHRRMRAGLAESIADKNITEEHWRILQVLSDEKGMSMGQLAEAALLNHPALTKNIDKLVSRGLVQRAADDEDSRKVLVYISDRGLEAFRRLKKSVDAHHEAIEEAMGPRKADQLKRLLERFVAQPRRTIKIDWPPTISMTMTAAVSGVCVRPARNAAMPHAIKTWDAGTWSQ